METLLTAKLFELIMTALIAVITWFIKQMSDSLKKIETDFNRLNTQTLLFQQETEFRLAALESKCKQEPQQPS